MAINNKKKALMTDPTSPYYLGAGVHPGKIPKPAKDEPEFDDWLAMNSMLVGWIFNTIDPSLRSSISHWESVKELWDDLKERFYVGNDFRIYQLKTDIANCKQSGLNVAAYYEKLKTMWEALDNYMKNPTCSCSGCQCGAAQELKQEREKEKVYQFLMGLDDVVFGTVRSNILSMSPLPNINKVHAMVATEETHKSLARTRDERADAVSFAAQTTPHTKSGQTRGGDRGACTVCGKHGHEAHACFEIIGYPDWWISGKNGRGAGRGNRGARNKVTGGGGVADERDSFPGLSTDQWSALMNILNSHKPTSSTEKLIGKQVNNSWLLDTGASNHMTGPHFEDSDWSG
ncbi:Retrotransposon gag domain [Sesbania bispinosa]|nr:Retrotransposon gag domain [Sesbania bispinosa]